MAKFVLRSPVLKVQFASQQFPHSGSGNLPNLLCLAYLLIVDFEPEHQHFFLVARLTLFPEGAARRGWTAGAQAMRVGPFGWLSCLEHSSPAMDLDRLVNGRTRSGKNLLGKIALFSKRVRRKRWGKGQQKGESNVRGHWSNR